MKNLPILFIVLTLLTCGTAFGAKYKVNSSGVVKTQTGKTISAPSNIINQNYYNNYSAPVYIANNQVNSGQVEIVDIVMDYSGSMSNWIGVAKRSMSAIVAQIPLTTMVGFRVFGHDYNGSNPGNTLQEVKKIVKKKGNKFSVVTQQSPLGSTTGACSATQQVTSITGANTSALLNGMNSVGLGGATPLVYALDRAVKSDFSQFDTTTPKKIVLITDGGENCGGNPCEFARRLMQKRSDVHIDVVLVSSNSKALNCLASTTGGHVYNIKNLSDFSTTVTNSIQSQPKQVEIPTDNDGQHYEYIK